MPCSQCGNLAGEGERFCRKCGTDLESSSLSYSALKRRQGVLVGALNSKADA